MPVAAAPGRALGPPGRDERTARRGCCRPGPSRTSRPATTLVAVDLAGRAPDDALARGETARAKLGASLIALGAARLAAGDVDDLAGLVPEYVTLPRGVTTEGGEVAWSHDPR